MTTSTTIMWPSDPERHADEASPLLARPSSIKHSQRFEYVEWLQEMWFLTKAAVPVILAYMLQNSLQTVSVLVVGRLSPEALSVAAFSYMFAMATAWLIALGGTSALDTLASSSFTRNKDKSSLGVLLQRGILVLTGFYAVVVIIWCFSEPPIPSTGKQKIAKLTHVSVTAQAIYHPGTYALLITSPLNAFLNWLLIYKLGLGLDGAPLATGISYWLSFLYLVGYTAFVQGRECWGGLDPRRAVANVGPFAKLALLGVVQVGTEWWAFEIVALAAGRLGTLSLAAQSVVMTADQIINTIPFGLGVAESSRLGNLLGAEDARGARRSAHSAAILSVLFGSAILAVLMGTRNWVGALVNCVSYYGGALPGGIYLAFNGGWGLAGLWMGQLVALSLAGALEWGIMASSNWLKEVKKAVDRLDHEEADAVEEGDEC
ncbi:transporter [Apiospora arundinis]